MQGLYYVEVEGWFVRFLPVEKGLEEEALREAIEVVYGSTLTRVLRAEHLIAIKLWVGRGKDLGHIRLILEQAKIDEAYLHDILERYGLTEKWKAFRRE